MLVQSINCERFSFMAQCLEAATVALINKKPAVPMVLKTPLSYDLRKMIFVEVRDRFYWADRTTGTLYDGEGRCLTSTSMQLIVETAGMTYEAMKKRFPDLRKSHVETKAKPGPKPRTPPAWGDQV